MQLKTILKTVVYLAFVFALVGGAMEFHRWTSLSLETGVRRFNSVPELQAFAGENDWWVPKFLPKTSREIRHKLEGDSMTHRFAAKFSSHDSATLGPLLSDVPAAEWVKITPHWGKGVFPRELLDGRFPVLTNAGFRIAAVNTEAVPGKPWYVAVQLDRGVIYAWNVNR